MIPKHIAHIISRTESKGGVVERGEGSTSISSLSNGKDDYVIDKPREQQLNSSLGSQFDLLQDEFSHESNTRLYSREDLLHGVKDRYHGLVIHPEHNRFYITSSFILVTMFFICKFDWLKFCILPLILSSSRSILYEKLR